LEVFDFTPGAFGRFRRVDDPGKKVVNHVTVSAVKFVYRHILPLIAIGRLSGHQNEQKKKLIPK
jgi:predicted N-acetyltransferase YhbS